MSLRNALHSMASKPCIAAPRPNPLVIYVKRITMLSIGAVAMLYVSRCIQC